jgi:hypothetical protein
MDIVYVLTTGDDRYKVGKTTESGFKKRLQNLQTGNDKDLVLFAFNCEIDGLYLEKRLKYKYRQNKIKGEWFVLKDRTLTDFMNTLKRLDFTII